MKILVVDDYKTDREMLAEPFLADHDVKCASDLHEAEQVLKNWWPDVALVDAIFPKSRNSSATFAFEPFLDMVESKRPLNLEIPQVVMISGQNDAAKRFDDVRQWLLYGRVADVIPKSTANVGVDFFKAVVRLRVENLLDRQRWRAVESNAQSASEWFVDLGIISNSPKIFELKKHLIAAARSPACVLLVGHSGTGKELFAQAIRRLARPGKEFQELDCAAISPELFEWEVFGMKQAGGKFAIAPFGEKVGILEAALDGIVFFDEIHNLKLEHQAKMLRALQERRFRKVGATEHTPFLAKFISATNTNLAEEVAKGTFRSDLYWRIAGFEINIPDLADRREDIPVLTDYFLKKFVRENREKDLPCLDIHLDDRCRDLLVSAPWKGNVRELQTVIEKTAQYAIMGSKDSVVISPELLLEVNPSLRLLTPPVSTSDKVLDKSGIGAQRWSELDESKVVTIVEAIKAHLSDAGRIEFEKFQAALRPRDPNCDDKAPGRERQDPAAIHCLKALLFILLRPENRTTVQDLMRILDLRWAQAKKVLEVLAAEQPSIPQYAAFVKLPSRGRQLAQMAREMIKPKDLLDPS